MKPQHCLSYGITSSAIAALTSVALIGCGDGRPPRVPISGQVLIDGKPLTYGSVRFIPSDARASLAQLDSTGHFTLNCFDREDGAVLGKHRVSVMAAEPLSRTKVLWHAPKKYAETSTSGLEQNITEQNKLVVINLTWDGAKPFTETVDAD
jgi:hypothetical protein